MFNRRSYYGRYYASDIIIGLFFGAVVFSLAMRLFIWILIFFALIFACCFIKELLKRKVKHSEKLRYTEIQTSLGIFDFPTWRIFANQKETGYRQGGDAQHVACIKQILINANGGERLSKRLAELCVQQLGGLISRPLKKRLYNHLI